MSSTKDTIVLIINSFSLNFSSIEIEEGRVSSSQNQRTLGGGGGVLEDEKGQTRGKGGSKLGILEWTYFLTVPLWNLTCFTFLVQKNCLWSEIPGSIIPGWKVFSVEFVKIWSIRVEMLHSTRVGHLINCFKEWIWQNSCYIYLS